MADARERVGSPRGERPSGKISLCWSLIRFAKAHGFDPTKLYQWNDSTLELIEVEAAGGPEPKPYRSTLGDYSLPMNKGPRRISLAAQRLDRRDATRPPQGNQH
jgi:hypothetical protein